MGQGFGSAALWVKVGCDSVVGFGPVVTCVCLLMGWLGWGFGLVIG